ncbi:cholesterol 24-hydroxylase-like, partial [Brachionus plicatilis]
ALARDRLKTDNIDIEDLVDDFLTFFVAGQETTSNMLAFSILELGQNPKVLKKLKDEVDLVIGYKQHINSDDLNKLKYLNTYWTLLQSHSLLG